MTATNLHAATAKSISRSHKKKMVRGSSTTNRGSSSKNSNGKLPVFIMHGINGQFSNYARLKQYLEQSGFEAHVLAVDYGLASIYQSLDTQLAHMEETIDKVKKENNIREHHLICHSMGGLLCRGYLQTRADHSVQVFISLSSPHMGQFGIPKEGEKFLPAPFRNVTNEALHDLLYQPAIQKVFSVANFWKDPFHYGQYQKVVTYLPRINNETGSSNNPAVLQYKSNFMKLKKAVFYGSLADEVIQPPASALFQYWKISASPVYQLVPMTEQPIYTLDVFGLKTMHMDGRLSVIEVPGVKHTGWVEVKSIYTQYIEPYLY